MRKIIQKQGNILSLKFFAMIFAFVLLLSSCDCMLYCCGTVYDSYTKQPIDSVKCTMQPNGRGYIEELSDSIGRFSVSSGMMGCFFIPPKVKVTFSKTGYTTKTVKSTEQEIYLDKE